MRAGSGVSLTGIEVKRVLKMVKTMGLEFTEIREVLRYHQRVSQRLKAFYNVDCSSASNYFGCSPEFADKIVTYFDKLRAERTPIVHLDICGVATVQSLGGNVSYCFSLHDDKRIDSRGNHIIHGDLFCQRDFNRFLEEVKSQQEAPALITFRPIVGLQVNDATLHEKEKEGFREVTEGILEKRFIQCISVLRKGGYMFIERPFQTCGTREFIMGLPQEKWDLSEQIKTLAEEYGCSLKIEGSICGPKFLLRKRRK